MARAGEAYEDGPAPLPRVETLVNSYIARTVAVLALLLTLAACVVYEPVYATGGGTPATYERAWNAAVGSYHDQGVSITAQDRSMGVIEGRKGAITVKSRVVTQADGKVRVEMNTGGTLSEDPGLPDRMSRAYDARMGRY
jgi:hypothetical protein